MMDMEPLYWLMTLNSLANPWVYLAFNWNLLCLGRLRRGVPATQTLSKHKNIELVLDKTNKQEANNMYAIFGST